MGWIEEIISYIFVELIYQEIVLRLFKGIKYLGIILLKLLTLSKRPIAELVIVYENSSKPYFLGFGFVSGVIYLILYFCTKTIF